MAFNNPTQIEVSNLGKGLLWHKKAVKGTPALRLVPDAWKELLDRDLCDEFIVPVHETHEVLYLEYKFQVLGFILFQEITAELWVNLSYVAPDLRGAGLYTSMFDALKQIARDRNISRVSGATFVGNKEMLAGYQATGRKQQAQIWCLDL